jgi:MFS family permease
VHKRYSSFYLISSVGSSLSGILAFCFMQMAGLAGLDAWRWIFIMEGLLTIVVSGVGFLLLVNFPQEAHKSWRFLTGKEEAYIIRRINKDRQDADKEAFALGKFLKPALDLKVWGFAFIFL